MLTNYTSELRVLKRTYREYETLEKEFDEFGFYHLFYKDGELEDIERFPTDLLIGKDVDALQKLLVDYQAALDKPILSWNKLINEIVCKKI